MLRSNVHAKISDHSLLNFAVTIPVLKCSNKTKMLRNYRKADFNQIKDELFLFLQTFLNGFEESSVEYNWMLLKTKKTELANRFFFSSCNRLQSTSSLV